MNTGTIPRTHLITNFKMHDLTDIIHIGFTTDAGNSQSPSEQMVALQKLIEPVISLEDLNYFLGTFAQIVQDIRRASGSVNGFIPSRNWGDAVNGFAPLMPSNSEPQFTILIYDIGNKQIAIEVHVLDKPPARRSFGELPFFQINQPRGPFGFQPVSSGSIHDRTAKDTKHKLSDLIKITEFVMNRK